MTLTPRQVYALRYAAHRQLAHWAERDFKHELGDDLANAARVLGDFPHGCELYHDVSPERGRSSPDRRA